MARTTAVTDREGRLKGGALVLDCQGLSLLLHNDPRMVMRVVHARDQGFQAAVVSGLTLLEAQNPKVNQPRWDYVISKLTVVEVTHQITKEAMKLLRTTGLHGHKYAIDAVVAATALGQRGFVAMATSDTDDMAKLCGGRVHLIPV